MKILKRRTVKWSLEEIESRPGVTTAEIMEECIKCMARNGWDLGEMATWFNNQRDPQGRPKFLNEIGKPFQRSSISLIQDSIRKRRRSRSELVQSPKSSVFNMEPFKPFITERNASGDGARKIFDELVANHAFPGNYYHVRNYIIRNLRVPNEV